MQERRSERHMNDPTHLYGLTVLEREKRGSEELVRGSDAASLMA